MSYTKAQLTTLLNNNITDNNNKENTAARVREIIQGIIDGSFNLIDDQSTLSEVLANGSTASGLSMSLYSSDMLKYITLDPENRKLEFVDTNVEASFVFDLLTYEFKAINGLPSSYDYVGYGIDSIKRVYDDDTQIVIIFPAITPASTVELTLPSTTGTIALTSDVQSGASGTYSADGKLITVTNGIITSIV